ncbi:hypothetical protein LX32DRAFT_650920 [Colletotrichum zoysiae]|uniref:Uncharacterized protein n=1 Tax=Colletotrichum zoysiae TaxID=1216348 RepID=A0AAD9HP06_9PEZI|nr:hypothetical protein LX32DRAFT_650920 [Colletotrichum zoysiae]
MAQGNGMWLITSEKGCFRRETFGLRRSGMKVPRVGVGLPLLWLGQARREQAGGVAGGASSLHHDAPTWAVLLCCSSVMEDGSFLVPLESSMMLPGLVYLPREGRSAHIKLGIASSLESVRRCRVAPKDVLSRLRGHAASDRLACAIISLS